MGGRVRAVLMVLAAVEKPAPGIFLGLDFFSAVFMQIRSSRDISQELLS